MAIIKADYLKHEDILYQITPPVPTDSDRGGIIASSKSSTDTVEIKLGDDGKLYAPTYPPEYSVASSESDGLMSSDMFDTLNDMSENRIGKLVAGTVFTIDGSEVTAAEHAEIFNDYDTNIATGKYSHAENYNTIAKGSYSHAEGYGTFAGGAASHAEGYDTKATARYAHAEGASTTASGNNSHSEGLGTVASGHYSHAEGQNTVSSGGYSHSEGNATKATETYAHAEGSNTIASKVGAHAEGNYTVSNGVFSHAEGYYTNAQSPYQHVRGKYNILDADSVYSTIIGNGESESARSNSHTLDWLGNAWFSGDIRIGGAGYSDENAKIVATTEDIANLVNSAPETLDTLGELATAFQENKDIVDTLDTAITTKANTSDVVLKIPQELTIDEINQVRMNIHSVGQYATGLTYTPYEVVETGLNTSDHTITETPLEPVIASTGAEIYNDYEGNIATGLYAIAQGYKTQATGNYSHSEGWWTTASGQCSVGSGLLSVPSGHFSHAEGTRTKATTNNAHSEGDMTVASGRQSHAEGSETVASGFCAHSEGSKTKATNYYSHAEGFGTIAAGRNQTAMGKYNISDTTSLVIVGKGSNDSARSNAYKLDSSGNGWFSGDVYTGSTSGTNKDEGSKKLATEAYVLTQIDELNSIRSHIGMIIQSTKLDTMEKVIDIYGGTEWVKIEGMFLLGQSSDYAINSTGGEAVHTLTKAEMPSHGHNYAKVNSTTNSHTLTIAQMPSHGHTYNYPGTLQNYATGNEPNAYGSIIASVETHTSGATGGGQGHSHGIGTTSAATETNGSGSAHNNMPPYKAVYIWERTA